MIRSYPLVQPALAFERFSVSNMVCVVRHEGLPGGLTGRGEIGQRPECLQGEQRGARLVASGSMDQAIGCPMASAII